MKNIRIILVSSLLIVTGAWFAADSLIPQPFEYFGLRSKANQLSGVIAIACMSLCMLLATRPVWLERLTHGMDKAYKLHKWLGIGALVASLVHFWFAKVTKWLVGWGLLTRPERKRPPMTGDIPWNRQWRDLAETLGEWAFYIALVLLIMALVKRIPYRVFVKLHQYLAVAYLALAFHSVVLIKQWYWQHPVGWLTAILLVAGSVSAIWVLCGRTGKSRLYQATVSSIKAYPEMDCHELTLDVPHWPGHRAGQFAFVRSLQGSEKAHPFTIASAWARDGRLVFLIKNLGDYTARLPQHFAEGTRVSVEGPYGRFDFQDAASRQVWVATGVGITPFLARLDERLRGPQRDDQAVDLYYTYRHVSPEFLGTLHARAKAAGVTLHEWNSTEKGHLTAAYIRDHAKDASVWYCGVGSLGAALQRVVPNVQRELFEMR